MSPNITCLSTNLRCSASRHPAPTLRWTVQLSGYETTVGLHLVVLVVMMIAIEEDLFVPSYLPSCYGRLEATARPRRLSFSATFQGIPYHQTSRTRELILRLDRC